MFYSLCTDYWWNGFPEERQYFRQYVNTRPHTINNIVNTTNIDNITDRVRPAIR